MARYRGPKSKIARRYREAIFGPDKVLEKKNYPPGQHGASKRRGKKSEYGVQLMEKQKAKDIYGLLERQFKNTFKRAARKKGITGELLLQLLESRLDNVVYRMGIAPTRRGARQLVSHNHIVVNNEVVNLPSFTVKPDDIIAVRERSKSLEVITSSLMSRNGKYSWIEWDNNLKQGRFVVIPSREEIPENIKEQLIVELYSK